MLFAHSVVAVLASTSLAQSPDILWSTAAAALKVHFEAVTRLGDIDADGVDDFGVGCDDRALVFAGADGAILHEFFLVGSADFITTLPIADAGDVDHDGFDDVAVGMPNDTTAPNFLSEQRTGSARVFSGQDGSLLRVVYGPSHARLGGSIESMGDLDGDGSTEIAIAAQPLPNFSGAHRIVVANCSDGATRYVIEPPTDVPSSGHFVALANVGDCSGDGVPDLAITYYGAPFFDSCASLVMWTSGADGTVLRTFTDPKVCIFGAGLGATGDLDGDGQTDVLIGSYFGVNDPHAYAAGIVRAYSGATGNVLWAREGADSSGGFGEAMMGIGDVDLDGEIDVAAPEASRTFNGYPSSGMVHVFSQGSGHSLDCALESIAPAPFSYFGNSIAAADDLDLDAAPDLAIVTLGDLATNSRVERRSLSNSVPQPDRFLLGSELRGKLGGADSHDDAEFQCLAGSKLQLKFEPKQGDLRVRVEIRRVGHHQTLKWTPNPTTKSAKKTFHIAKDGTYELRVIRIEGTSGTYSLETSLAKAPNGTPFGTIETIAGTGQDKPPRLQIRATAGTSISGSIEGVKGIPAQPQIELVMPNGEQIDLSSSLDLTFEDETGIEQVELPVTGTYELRTVGPGGSKTKAKFVLDIYRLAGHERIDID